MGGVTIFAVTLCAVLVAALARKFEFNAPLCVLAVALAASFIPTLHEVEVEPELILGIVLPPLLYSAALSSSLQDFRASISPILRLGVGAVIVTTAVVGVVVHAVDPNIPISAALLLGAVVAPPDAVSAAAVGRKLGLPRRIMTLLGGESLINDATSLTLFRVALASAGATGALWQVGLQAFTLAVIDGVAVGLLLALAAQAIRSTLRDPTTDTVIGVLLPFVAYWLAEEFEGSGVLAVVAAGFYIGTASPRATVSTRLHEEPIWASIDLLLESFTFALIGLQLRWVIANVSESATEDTLHAFLLTGLVFGVTIAIRPIYIYATHYLSLLRPPWVRRPAPAPTLSWRDLLITSWAGMRGVVTLAAALAIPVRAEDGVLIPGRATIQLAAYMVAIGTLLLQGLTLPGLIRRLRISNADEAAEDDAEEARVRLLAARKASEVIHAQVARWSDQMGKAEAERVARFATEAVLAREAAAATLLRPDSAADSDYPELDEQLGAALARVGRRIGEVSAEDAAAKAETGDGVGVARKGETGDGAGAVRKAETGDGAGTGEKAGVSDKPKTHRTHAELRARGATLSVRAAELRTRMIRAQRGVIVSERNAGRLNETVMRRMLRELDLEEESQEASWTNRL
ncbi:MAG: sodium:proton antiporter [Bifidobacteriaceae bacterium]|nr:sodium:proton antiporter [Bifidobacteriaceae bacterium]